MSAAPRDILVIVDGPQAAEWQSLLRAAGERQGSDRAVRCWPDDAGNANDIGYACVWRPPTGVMATLPNLRAIVNFGAGVDALLADPSLPDVPIMRAAHPDLTARVVGYVVMQVLSIHRQQRRYDVQQLARHWEAHTHPPAADIHVGVMGLGVIGAEAASVLVRLGYSVAGWSRTPREVEGIECLSGAAGLDAFLTHTDVLVCLLPSTPQTDGILALDLFRKLRRDGPLGGAFLINAGRGRLQIDADIIAALDEGALAGAVLDVFPQEPLPAEHPLWAHPKVVITPHIAGDISPALFADHVMRTLDAYERGAPLPDVVDRGRGY